MFTWDPANEFAMLNWFSMITPDIIKNWFTEDLLLIENEDFWRVGWSDVNVKDTNEDLQGFDKEYDIDMVYNNVYPNLDFSADFLFKYNGTIPAKWTLSHFIDPRYIVNGPLYTGEGYYGENWLEDLWIYNHGDPNIPDATPHPGYGIWIYAYEIDPNFIKDQNQPVSYSVIKTVVIDNQLHKDDYFIIKIYINIPQDDQFQGCSGLLQTDFINIQWAHVN